MWKKIENLLYNLVRCAFPLLLLAAIAIFAFFMFTEIPTKDTNSVKNTNKQSSTIFDYNTILIAEKTYAVNLIAALVTVVTLALGLLSIFSAINLRRAGEEIKETVKSAKEVDSQLKVIRDKLNEQDDILNMRQGTISHAKFFHFQEGSIHTASYVDSSMIRKADKILFNPSAIQYIHALAIKTYQENECNSASYLWGKMREMLPEDSYVEHYAFLSDAFKFDEMKIPANDPRWNDIKNYFSKVTKSKKVKPELWVDRGDLYARLARKEGDEIRIHELWKTAEKCYNMAEKIKPNNATIFTSLARLLSVKARVEIDPKKECTLWEKSDKYFIKALICEPNNLLIKRYIAFYCIYQGYANLNKNRKKLWEKSEEYCEEMMKNKEYFNLGMFTLAILLIYEGNVEKDENIKKKLWNRAENYCIELTRYHIPEDPEIWYNWSKLCESQAKLVVKDEKELLLQDSKKYLDIATNLNKPFLDFLEYAYSNDTCGINNNNFTFI